MADSSVFKRLKYKNIALALAVMLLTTLAIGRACSDEQPVEKSQPDTSSQASEPAADDSEASAIAPFDAGNLEKNFSYYNVRNAEALGEGDLVLLNTAFRFNGVPGDLESIYTYLFDKAGTQIAWASTTSIQGSKRMLTALNEMLCAFYSKTNLSTVMVTDIYNTATERGKPCFEHESGLAVDFQLCLKDEGTYPPFTGEGEYSWFSRYSYQFGFIERYSGEKTNVTGVEAVPYHFRYVGKPHAEIMMYNDLTLEDYIEYIKQYSVSAPLSFESEDGSRYAIFYVEKSDEKTTNIPIPRDEDDIEYVCDISGDNRSGYIVTVHFDETGSLPAAEESTQE